MATDEDEDVDSGWGTEDVPLATGAPIVPQSRVFERSKAAPKVEPAISATAVHPAKGASTKDDPAKARKPEGREPAAPKATLSRPEPTKAEPAHEAAAKPAPISVAPAKPASRAPPPKLAVGPRPLSVPPPPRQPSLTGKTGDPDLLEAGLQGQPFEKLDAVQASSGALPTARRPGLLRPPRADVQVTAKPLGVAASVVQEPSGPGSAPQSGAPKSRSFTPKVTNAVEQARELDVRVATDPNSLTPPGTSVIAAALAVSARRDSNRPQERPTPLRMPSVTSRDPSDAPRPAAIEARPASTSLRFPASKPRPIPRDRKQTVKLSVATQNFTLDLLAHDGDPTSTPIPTGAGPKSPASSATLDLHLPDDLTSPHEVSLRAANGPAPSSSVSARDEFPEIEVADEGEFSDSFSDLPIDEVLEAVRQSSMPPASAEARRVGSGGPGSLGSSLHGDPPQISDLRLDGLFPSGDEHAPVSDLPPTVRGAPPDELRFVSLSEAPAVPAVEVEDARLTPIRERFDRGDFAGALLRAEAFLEEEPGHEGAKGLVRSCQERVKETYISRLGSCESVLHVVMSRDKIQDLAFDHRAGFLISLIDGVATLDDVLDMSGMPQLEALRLLFELQQEGVIGATPAVARA